MDFVGVLMLETRFPRPLGDIGNPDSFRQIGIPAQFLVVAGASPARVVKEADPALLLPFIEGGRALIARGATLITTSCGFLAMFQRELECALPVPVLSSSLLQCRDIAQCGIVTIDAASLGEQVLAGAGVPRGTPIEGVDQDGEFYRRILNDEPTLDLTLARADVVAAAQTLTARYPTVRAIVLECTNMPPYRDSVAKAVGRPVFDIMTLVKSRWDARQ